MQFNIHIHHHDRELERQIMTVSAAFQTALEGIRQTQSLVKSVETGLAVQTQMIADQGKQIADLQAQIAAGGTLSADDLAALAETNSDIADVNTSLQSNIPANTAATPSPQPIIPNVGNLNVNPLT